MMIEVDAAADLHAVHIASARASDRTIGSEEVYPQQPQRHAPQELLSVDQGQAQAQVVGRQPALPVVAVPVANNAPPVAVVASAPAATGAASGPGGTSQVASGAAVPSATGAGVAMAQPTLAPDQSAPTAVAASGGATSAGSGGTEGAAAGPPGAASGGRSLWWYILVFLLVKGLLVLLFLGYRTLAQKEDASRSPAKLQVPGGANSVLARASRSNRATYRKSVLMAQSQDDEGSESEVAPQGAVPATGRLTPIPRTPSPATPTSVRGGSGSQTQSLDF